MSKSAAQDGAFSITAGTAIETILSLTSIDRLDVRILLMHALSLSRAQLITQSHRALTDTEAQQVSRLFQRRIAGEPIAYIVGEREFYGLPLHVTPDVLIPRPDTELLVELALEKLPVHGSLLDMGTGSGAIAIAVAHSRADANVTALDQSSAALAIARGNAERHDVKVRFIQSDWYSALSNECFNVIAANPPYIPEHDIHLTQGDLRFEPISALTDHADGLTALNTIADGAARHLAPGGWLLMEHGYNQASSVRSLLAARGFNDVRSWSDLAGIERVTGGRISSIVQACT
ncbi:peptide chain release factor N(5)-glutamine methyltransferase [Oxalobacteraceae bacterium R-40]|uniref:Release factor glutamine methyltransferase n=1 Tax=Keguizhuia sedimenti TaxID=3064264 RepID=A0ABU1BST1_9BURK|nr:peptide chain release factor N(5)-glutamine methyltransferase [Oxalobacteraceae bacterium R-40]